MAEVTWWSAEPIPDYYDYNADPACTARTENTYNVEPAKCLDVTKVTNNMTSDLSGETSCCGVEEGAPCVGS